MGTRSLAAAVGVICVIAGLSGCGGPERLADGDQRAVGRALVRIGVVWGSDSVRGERFGCGPVRSAITPEAREGVATLERVARRDGAVLYQPEGPDSARPMRDLLGAELHILDVCFERLGTPGEGWREAYAALVDARCPERSAAASLRHCGVPPKGGW